MLLRSLTCSALATAVLIAGCGGGGDDSPATLAEPAPTTPVAVGDTVALTASGRLLSFNRAAPSVQVGAVFVTGLAAGENLLGIDYRPADGLLYGLGSTGNIYTLNPATGAATLKSALKPAAGDDNPYGALAGTDFGIDFNPAADRLRVVGNTGQNLRINVDTGDTITDGALSAGTAVTAAAYTNSFAGTTSTQLFDLDFSAGRLHLQDPPNNGTLNAGVPLGLIADAANGFDIDARTNTGYAALRAGGELGLYTINLAAATNAAARVGAITGGEALRGIALAPAARPTAIALTGDNRLAAFDLRTPNTFSSVVIVSGLGVGEGMLGIDFRPRDGLLWGLTSFSRLVTIDPATGAATVRATLFADATDTTAAFTALSGTVTAVDFNPAADRLRVITSSGQNLRIVVETATTNGITVTAGATTTDGVINREGAAAVVAAGAYTNSFAGTAATALYNLELNADQLTLQNPPNNGTQVNVGALGIDIAGPTALDIGGGANGLALAALRAGNTGPFSLYSISLATGQAAFYGNTSGNAALSQIGGANGPGSVVDLALRF